MINRTLEINPYFGCLLGDVLLSVQILVTVVLGLSLINVGICFIIQKISFQNFCGSDEPLYLCIVYMIQLSELWPIGVMDSLGIKKAISRAKDRQRASHGDEVWNIFIIKSSKSYSFFFKTKNSIYSNPLLFPTQKKCDWFTAFQLSNFRVFLGFLTCPFFPSTQPYFSLVLFIDFLLWFSA